MDATMDVTMYNTVEKDLTQLHDKITDATVKLIELKMQMIVLEMTLDHQIMLVRVPKKVAKHNGIVLSLLTLISNLIR